ncbi:MAG: hypothetical protein AB7T32_04760 [Dehalococcoidia bacterium]
MSRKKQTLQPPRPQAAAPATAPISKERRNDWLIVAALLLGVAVYRFIALAAEPGPPGSDAGNWLAFTRDLFGSSTKAAESMYFPGTLVVLKALLIFLPDLAALKTLAVLSSVAAGVPFFFLARRCCTPVIAAYLTFLFLIAGYLIEMMSWGGYPQLLATAYLLGAMYLLDAYLHSGERRELIGSAVALALIAFTHHFTVLVAVPTFAVYLGWMTVRSRAQFAPYARRVLTWAVVAGGLSLLTLPWYLRYMSLLSGDGSLNANARQLVGFNDVISYVFSEAPLTWIAFATIVPVIALLPLGGDRLARLRPMAIAVFAGPIPVYMATHEVRSFQPMQAGMLLCLGIIVMLAVNFLKNLNLSTPVARVSVATQAMAALGLLMIFVPNSHARMEAALSRFGAMNPDAVQAMNWLRDETPEGSVVLPSDFRGWMSYAWWVEGYGQRPAYGLFDPSFLAFKQEKVQSAVANRIVDPSTSPAETQALLQEAGIRYFFIYIPSGGDFQNLVDRVPTQLAFQNKDFVIFKVADSADAAAPSGR